MSDSPPPAQAIGIGYEPDDIPVKMLLTMALAVTMAVVATVMVAVGYFDHIVDQELQAKGYSERIEGAVPR